MKESYPMKVISTFMHGTSLVVSHLVSISGLFSWRGRKTKKG